MKTDYTEKDYKWISELTDYPKNLNEKTGFFKDTSTINIPDNPIEKIIFQEKAKSAIRKIAQNKGHILMVGRPGTGKSMLANMFNIVLEKSMGDYLKPKKTIAAFPGKDNNHIRFAYEEPEALDKRISQINRNIDIASNNVKEFSLSAEINSIKKVKIYLILIAIISAIAGFFFQPAFILTSLTGIGAIFLFIQENNQKTQEKIQRETNSGKQNMVKHLTDMIPEILFDPREENKLMVRISEPNSKNMKGGFRHDPYQSGNLQTPPHKRAFLGAHAKAPVLYIDELKTLIKTNYMSDLLEIMQNKKFILEGGGNSGSGAADKSENSLKAENIIIACCNYDTLAYLQKEGDGAFLSRIEDKGEVVNMENSVPETKKHIHQIVQYIKQEIISFEKEIKDAWGEILKKEGHEGVKQRCEHIFGKKLPEDYKLIAREFSKEAVCEIIKELRTRGSDQKLTCILRPVNGIIKTAEFNAIFDNAPVVEPKHVQNAIKEHISLEGGLSKDVIQSKKDLKKYINSLTDSIGYVVGLAVIESKSSGQMFGQPLPIHCQIISGGLDTVIASGKIGDIAKGAAQNVRASIKKIFSKINAPYIGHEMHIEYIQAHGGVEGDSASVAIATGLISDYIKQPVNQKIAITGSLTGDIILPVGGVTEKIRSVMDIDLNMEGVCIPWQNKHDIEPLLINKENEFVKYDNIPAIKIFRKAGKREAFNIYFCKTKYDAYKIMLGLDQNEIETKMSERSKNDFDMKQNLKAA